MLGFVISHLYIFLYVFFFFKQKTAYEMRISDWSSDVCSSDLVRRELPGELDVHRVGFTGSRLPGLLPKNQHGFVAFPHVLSRVHEGTWARRMGLPSDQPEGGLIGHVGNRIARPADRKSTRLNSSH